MVMYTVYKVISYIPSLVVRTRLVLASLLSFFSSSRASRFSVFSILAARVCWLNLSPPLTTESPTTHSCTVQHHVPIDPYAERMPRADCSSNTIRDSISRVAPSLRGPRSAPAFRPHCDGTCLCRAQMWRSGTHARKQCEIWTQFQPNSYRAYLSLVHGSAVRSKLADTSPDSGKPA